MFAHPRLGHWLLITMLTCYVIFAPGGMLDWLFLMSLFLVVTVAGHSRFLALLVPTVVLYLLALLNATR